MTERRAPAGGPRGGRSGRALRGSVQGVAWAAAVATLLVRGPFVARRLWDHDSVQFALGVLDFDLAAHHPHPPGYPLYLGILKALAAVGVPPLAGMVGLSLAAAAGGAAAFTLVAARLAAGAVPEEGRSEDFPPLAAAVLAGALYATNPLLWFYAELPLVYAVEGGLTAVLAWAALRMADGMRPFLLACALFALAGGVRPSTLVLLFPLFLYGLYRAWRWGGFLRPGRVMAGAGVGLAGVAVWLVPLLAEAGGLAAYRALSREHFSALLPLTSVLYGAGWPALAHNAEVLVKWAVQGLVPAAAMVLTAWGWALWRRRPGAIGAGLRALLRQAGWLLAWAVPPVLFFALFHVTKAGYTLVHLVPLMAAAVLAVVPAVASPVSAVSTSPTVSAAAVAVPARPSRGRRRLVGVALVPALVGTALFLFGVDRRDDQPRWLAAVLHEHNARAITRYEQDLDALLAALGGFPPERTVLAAVELSGEGGAGAEGFLYPYHRHLQWYAPDYPVALLVPEQAFALVTPGQRRDFERRDGTWTVPSGTHRILFVLAAPGAGDRLSLPPAEVVVDNPTFRAVAVPFRGRLRVGSLTLTAAPGTAHPETSAPVGATGADAAASVAP